MRWEPLVHHQMREGYVEKELAFHDMQPTSRAAEQHVRTEADPTTPPPSAMICGGTATGQPGQDPTTPVRQSNE